MNYTTADWEYFGKRSTLTRKERQRWAYLSDKKFLPGGVTRDEWLEWASLNQRLRDSMGQNKKTQKDIKDK